MTTSTQTAAPANYTPFWCVFASFPYARFLVVPALFPDLDRNGFGFDLATGLTAGVMGVALALVIGGVSKLFRNRKLLGLVSRR